MCYHMDTSGVEGLSKNFKALLINTNLSKYTNVRMNIDFLFTLKVLN
jgi:hypothetical protein